MALVWFLAFSLSIAAAPLPLLAELQENKLETNHSRIHLDVYHVQGPESSLTPDSSLSFSDFLRRDDERAKALNSILTSNSTGRGRSTTNSASSSAKSASIPLNSGLSLGTGNYYVKIGIGTPTSYQAVLMDTGSSFSWIQCQPCKLYCHSQAGPVFDPSASKTYKSVSCTSSQCSLLKQATLNDPLCTASGVCVYTASYGDTSYSVGYLSQDLLSLSQSQTSSAFVFGCGQDNEGLFGRAGGLLGLARDKLSMIAQVSPKLGYAFSYCLPTATSSAAGGFLKIGSPSSSSPFKFTPMVTDSGQTSSLYHLRLTSIAVAGTPLRVAATEYRVPTIIDSGTVITRLPMSLYVPLRDAFVNIMSKRYARAPGYSILDTCFRGDLKTMRRVPEIEMMFEGGAGLNLGATNLLIEGDKGVVCLAFAGSSQMAIIGNHQQQTFEVAYDVSNSRIGFVPAACH